MLVLDLVVDQAAEALMLLQVGWVGHCSAVLDLVLLAKVYLSAVSEC